MDETRINLFKQVIETDPDDPMLHYSLGLEYAKGEMHQDAVDSFREALKCKEDYSAAYLELGKSLAASGQTEETVNLLKKGIAVADGLKDMQPLREMRGLLEQITGEKTCSGS